MILKNKFLLFYCTAQHLYIYFFLYLSRINKLPKTGSQQLWKIEPVGDAYRIINVNSGLALDIASKSRDNGGNIQQWGYNGGANQLWYFTKLN